MAVCVSTRIFCQKIDTKMGKCSQIQTLIVRSLVSIITINVKNMMTLWIIAHEAMSFVYSLIES